MIAALFRLGTDGSYAGILKNALKGMTAFKENLKTACD